MEVPRDAKPNEIAEKSPIISPALRRLSQKSECSEPTESDGGSVVEAKPLYDAKRGKAASFTELISNHLAASRASSDEKFSIEKENSRWCQERSGARQKKLELEDKKLDIELHKFNADLELRKNQQEAQNKKDEMMLDLVRSLASKKGGKIGKKTEQHKKKNAM